MTGRGVLVAATTFAVLLLTACGSADTVERDQPAGPRPIATDDASLAAALPTLAQVPGGADVDLRCPEDADRCAAGEADSWSIGVDVEPQASDVALERIGTQRYPIDVAAVSVRRLADEEAAVEQREANLRVERTVEGDVDLPAEDVGGRSLPPMRGSGEIEALDLDGWDGFRSDLRVLAPEREEPALLVTNLHVTNGPVLVSVFVSLSAADREVDAAAALATTLAQDALDRLADSG